MADDNKMHQYRIWRSWTRFVDTTGVHVLQAEPHHARAWVGKIRQDGVLRATVRSYIKVMRTIYYRCIESGYLEENVFKAVPMPPAATRTSYDTLSRAQALKVLEICKTADREVAAAIRLMLLNGVRSREFLRLRKCDVKAAEYGLAVEIIERKTGQKQLILVPPDTAALLPEPGSKSTDPIYSGTLDQLRESIRKIGEEIGFRIGPAVLRVSFFTLALDAGVGLAEVADTAGHIHAGTTLRYDRGNRARKGSAAIPLDQWITSTPDS